MSYPAEKHEEHLREQGWLDSDQVTTLRAQVAELTDTSEIRRLNMLVGQLTLRGNAAESLAAATFERTKQRAAELCKAQRAATRSELFDDGCDRVAEAILALPPEEPRNG